VGVVDRMGRIPLGSAQSVANCRAASATAHAFVPELDSERNPSQRDNIIRRRSFALERQPKLRAT
jgi:hypothetical protein